MNRISYNCSNLVGAQCGYSAQSEWDACVEAVNEYYRPLATFAARFEKMILDIRALGFDALDIWLPGQLNFRWAMPEHLKLARALLDKHRMAVTSIGGDFGETKEEFIASCKLAVAVGTDLLSGTTPVVYSDRAFTVRALREYNLRLAIENHPERSSREMLDRVGDGAEGRIGTTVDTGWYATQHYDVVRAIEELDRHILHVHLKNVLDGEEHLNVGYGQGIVPMEQCVYALRRIGYKGDYCIENHPVDHDPTEEIREALGLMKRWTTTPL